MDSWNLEENNEDTFIKKEYIIDFLRQDIIVVRGATIEKVNVVDGEYRVTFAEQPLKDYEFNAVIEKKIKKFLRLLFLS